MDVRDCIRYQNSENTLYICAVVANVYNRSIRDVKASKLARKPNRNTKQNSVNPSNIAHTRRTVAS